MAWDCPGHPSSPQSPVTPVIPGEKTEPHLHLAQIGTESRSSLTAGPVSAEGTAAVQTVQLHHSPPHG